MKRLGIGIALFAVGFTATASAHIHLTNPLSWTDDVRGDPQKNGHCGDAAYTRAANPTRTTTMPPGSPLMVTWAETVPHNGHYRIAFQPNGTTFSFPPPGTAVGNFPTEDQTGMTDTTTGTIVLADLIPDGTLSRMITLPNMECANCTLQLIQVMYGANPYEPTLISNDLYYNCADITLSNGAPPPPPTPDAGVGGEDDAGTGSVGGANEVTGGCATSSGSTGLGLGIAMLLGLHRRRR